MGGPAERRRERETRKTDVESVAPSPEITEASTEQEQRPEGQRVRGDDPLAVAGREVQVGLGPGQGDVDHRRVEQDHQLGER